MPENKSKHVFISEEQIVSSLTFSLVPSLLGELSKDKKKEENYIYTGCYDSDGTFIGYLFEKK